VGGLLGAVKFDPPPLPVTPLPESPPNAWMAGKAGKEAVFGEGAWEAAETGFSE
jgi:hypothetical protein